MKTIKVLLLAFIALGTVVLAWRWSSSSAMQGPLGERWLAKLAVLPDDQLEAHLRQVAQRSDEASSALVAALVSSDDRVSRAAGQALHQLLDHWKQLPTQESGAKVATLAQQLAHRVGGMDAARRDVAVSLVQRIARWPIDRQQLNLADVVVNCERVLRSRPLPQMANQDKRSGSELPASLGKVGHRSTDAPRGAIELTGVHQLLSPSLPGGDLPVNMIQLPPLPPSLTGPPKPRLVPDGEPNLVPPTMHQLPRELFPEKNGLPGQGPPATVPEPRTLDTLRYRPTRAIHRATRIAGTVELSSLSDLELIKRLRHQKQEVQAEAARDLKDRGFDRLQLQLASRLADPNPVVRRQLVELLSELPVSPGRWLLWLSEDEDPQVRRDAVLRMATSRNPKLHQRLLVMRQTEPDARVQQQLRQWEKGQRN